MDSKTMLCPNCRTGADSYRIDSRSPFCPYLSLHTGQACARFEPMEKSQSGGAYETQSSR